MESEKKSAPPIVYPPYMDAVRLLIRVMRRHHACVERRIGDLGIHHSQHRMLMHLAGRTEQDLTQKEIAADLGISAAAVATTLKRLETKGYVARTMLGDDNRCNTIRITEAGLAKVAEGREVFETVDRLMFENFSEEELAAFITFMRRIDQNLDAAGAPEVCTRKSKD